MMTVKQMSSLTGVSVRTLQFYDEIGLLKPTQVTEAGYRMYDENTLAVLQQILFFKELDFTLKEIKAIMASPLYDRKDAFEKQRELIQIKRDRLNALLELLDRLIKGERTLDFREFDMSNYFQVLTDYKRTHMEEIIKQLGSMESFDEMISELKANEGHIAQMAVKQYGSIEKFTKAMEENLQHFLENGPGFTQKEADEAVDKTDTLTKKLTADLSKEAGSDEVQKIAGELVSLINESNGGMDMGSSYWSFMVNNYMTISNNLEYQGFLKCGMCAILENNILLPVNHAAHILCMCRKGEEPYEEFRNRKNGDKAAGAAPLCDRGRRRHV